MQKIDISYNANYNDSKRLQKNCKMRMESKRQKQAIREKVGPNFTKSQRVCKVWSVF